MVSAQAEVGPCRCPCLGTAWREASGDPSTRRGRRHRPTRAAASSWPLDLCLIRHLHPGAEGFEELSAA
jgi:hypothetical protein